MRIFQTPWPALTWTILIFILLIIPEKGLPASGILGVSNLDKAAHFILFGAFVSLWFAYLKCRFSSDKLFRLIWLLFFLSSAYGVGMEYVQLFFTNRHFEWLDIIADTAGAGLAASLIFLGQRKSPY